MIRVTKGVEWGAPGVELKEAVQDKIETHRQIPLLTVRHLVNL